MSFRKALIGVVLVAVCIGGALACGPNFPWQLLDDRDETVSDPIALSFAYEGARLVEAPQDPLRNVEPEDPTWGSSGSSSPEVLETERREIEAEAWRAVLPDPAMTMVALRQTLTAARDAIDSDSAMAAGVGLPVAVLEYIAGAIAYRADRFDAALRHFQAIDALPPEQRQVRAVAAAYMQGQIHQRLGEMERARTAFHDARAAALAGAPDPMGLAVASLGEEARLDLIEAGIGKAPWAVTPTDVDDATVARLASRAIRLYAEQAARGSKMALLSLRESARLIADDERVLGIAVADPLVRRLLVTWVVARDGQSVWDESLAGAADPIVVRVTDAVVARADATAGHDLDRLAALAYQAARYDMAEKLTAATTRPLGLWVRAKLALRRGDRAVAVRDWTAALLGTEDAVNAGSLDPATQIRLRGELAVMRLGQAEYRDSLRLLFPVAGTYWGDVAYVAERVLTVDELKAFVDSLPRVDPPAPKTDEEDRHRLRPVQRLRELLARRLVREGRNREALAYFPGPDESADARNEDRATAEDARGWLAAVEAARPREPFEWPWNRVARAKALFEVAQLARTRGMELMGTEGPPDQAYLGGNFPEGFGQPGPNGTRSEPSKLLGPDEAQRFAASAPKPDARFHYRTIATDHAVKAADYLPQRSQAYAATLCWAALYATHSRDQKRVEAIYRRYVATGAYQGWAKTFGRECPEPDFAAAQSFWQRRIAAWPGQIVDKAARHLWLVALAAVAGALLLAAVLGLRRARRTRQA